MSYMKKSLSLFIMVLFAFQLLAPSAVFSARPELELDAKAAVLIEPTTGKILYEKNAREPLPPASLTKIMTLLLAMEELEKGRISWDTGIIVSQKAWEMGGSEMFLDINQIVTFEDLIKGTAIISANDACVALAEYISGSEAVFVQRMNERAAELGLENTNFTNSHGLHHPDQYMSALDVARLAAYFIQTQPEAAAFQSETEFTFNSIRQFNRNPLLGVYPGSDGIKTGFTPEAGWSLAATAKQGDMRLVSIVMNCSNNAARREDSSNLLNYGFANYELLTLAEAGEVFAEAPVIRGEELQVNLVAVEPAVAVIPRGEAERVEQTVTVPDSLKAPVESGARVGVLRLTYQGEEVAEVELATSVEVKRLGFFASLWRFAGEFFAGLWNRLSPISKAN